MPDLVVALTSEWACLSLPFLVGSAGVWCLLDDWAADSAARLAARATAWASATGTLSVGLAIVVSARELWTIDSLCGIGSELVLYAWQYILAMQVGLLLSGAVPLAALLALRVAAARRTMASPDSRNAAGRPRHRPGRPVRIPAWKA